MLGRERGQAIENGLSPSGISERTRNHVKASPLDDQSLLIGTLCTPQTPRPPSYHSVCNDHCSQRRHEVHSHWWVQPGQRPLVENVFHMVPQPSKNGSGVPTQSQYQTLDADGRQVHRGHRIPSNVSMCSRLSTLTVIWPGTPSSLSKRN